MEVRLDEWLAKVSWLGELVSVFWWVEMDLLSGGAVKCPVMSLRVSLGLAWLWAARLLMFRVVFLFCWRNSVVYLALDLVGSCMELGFSVGMRNFG